MSENETVTISTPGHAPVTMTGKEFKELPNKINKLRESLGATAAEAAIIARCLIATEDLIVHNWGRISKIRDQSDESEVSIAVTFNVDCSGPTPKIITKLSYAQKFKDEREDVLANDAQPGLGLSDKP